MVWPAILAGLGSAAAGGVGAWQQGQDMKAAEGKSEKANAFAQLKALGLLEGFQPQMKQALGRAEGLYGDATSELAAQRKRTRDAYQFALGTITSQGAAAEQGIQDRERAGLGASDQVMRSRGLYQSSAAANAVRGVQGDANRARTDLAGQMGGLGASVATQGAQAEAQDTANYAQSLQGLGQFLQGSAQQQYGMEKDKANVILQTMNALGLDDQQLLGMMREQYGAEGFHEPKSGSGGGSNFLGDLFGTVGNLQGGWISNLF